MFRYRLIIEPDDNDTLLVTSPDLPIVTYGADRAEALRQAEDAIRTVLGSMMDAREDIEVPAFAQRPDEIVLKLPLQAELKVQLYRAMRAAGLTRADLQRRLGWQRESVDRLFRLDHNSRIEQLEQAFNAIGRTVDVAIGEAA